MSAEWQPQAPASWKVTLPCTRAEGEAVAELGELPGLDPAPVVTASEPDPARPDAWLLEAYVEQEPGPDLLAALATLAPSAADIQPAVERVEDADWVTVSQRWLEPIRAGRFFVHTAAHAGAVPPDAIAFHVEAGRAFGTGHHETTAGCLEVLDALAAEGAQFGRVADIGTGTGLLAMAAHALWPAAAIVASDIDPVAIDVARGVLAANALCADAIALYVADGVNDRAFGGARFDLVMANILAGPLVTLAPDIVNVVAPGGTILLAGLLVRQAPDVLDAYAQAGARLARRLDRGEWSILALSSHPSAS